MGKKKKRKRTNRILFVLTISGLLMLAGLFLLFWKGFISFRTAKVAGPVVEEAFLTPNPYSRPQKPLEKVKGIVVHYTANPGTDAMDNRNYFEGLREKESIYASSHYIIGLRGQIVQCIPLDEISYASNARNADTISIECCHWKKNGRFSKKTYQSLVELLAFLCGEYNLKPRDIIRHYDVTGKLCPLYFVKHEDAWKQLRKDVADYIEKYGK